MAPRQRDKLQRSKAQWLKRDSDLWFSDAEEDDSDWDASLAAWQTEVNESDMSAISVEECKIDEPDVESQGPRAQKTPKAKVARPSRQRALPRMQDLSPGMVCPLGETALEWLDIGSFPLGLCGPSELQSTLGRRRAVLCEQLPQLHLPKAQVGSLAELLRQKLKLCYLAKEIGASALKPCTGRADLAELILSFVPTEAKLAFTQNGGLMFADTGSANLNLFFKSIPKVTPGINVSLEQLLQNAWAESPETCLRQIFHLGASREGKQDRYNFYDAMTWLWKVQPATVLANLHLVPETNYWKGLLEILARICEGPARSLERDQALHRAHLQKRAKLSMPDCKEGWKPGSRLELATEALKRYDEDPLYRSLFERIGQLFAEKLREDLAQMQLGQRVSLCAKWCPLPQHSFDRRTLIFECIARWLFPATLLQFHGISERHYAFRVRDMLRKAISQLKEYMKVPERLMCMGRLGELSYQRVPATCMKINAKHFQAKDTVRFDAYMENLKKGRAKAKTGALQPHQLLRAACTGSGSITDRDVAQAQWEALVDQLRCSGVLEDCISVCDVSGSMSCPAGSNFSCMDVAVSLSLLLAEIAQGASARKIITFETQPQMVQLPATRQLIDLDCFVRRLPWGGTTNFFKVFELLLTMQPLPSRLIVFSDMQFNSAGGSATVLQEARKLYAARGLKLPQLIFWNLAAHHGSPALAGDEGVALVSGFSAAILKTLLQKGTLDPVGTMCKALTTPLMQQLRVVCDSTVAKELFQGRQMPDHVWEPEPPLAAASERPLLSTKQPWELLTVSLGTLGSSEAVAAFIGKTGAKSKELRKNLRQQLRHALGRPGHGLKLWLAVVNSIDTGRTLRVGLIRMREGVVAVRVKARLPQRALYAAVSKLKPFVEDAVQDAELRALKPNPCRLRRAARQARLEQEEASDDEESELQKCSNFEIEEVQSRETLTNEYYVRRLAAQKRYRRRMCINASRMGSVAVSKRRRFAHAVSKRKARICRSDSCMPEIGSSLNRQDRLRCKVVKMRQQKKHMAWCLRWPEKA